MTVLLENAINQVCFLFLDRNCSRYCTSSPLFRIGRQDAGIVLSYYGKCSLRIYFYNNLKAPTIQEIMLTIHLG